MNTYDVAFHTQANLMTASMRYRMCVAAIALREHGYRVYVGPTYSESLFHIFVKHFGNHLEAIDSVHGVKIFDVTDNHLNGDKGDWYRSMLSRSDVITCNSVGMNDCLTKLTTAPVVTIFDPYLGGRYPADKKPPARRLLWFGHSSNIHSLKELLFALPDDLYDEWHIVSDIVSVKNSEGVLPLSNKIKFIPFNMKNFREQLQWATLSVVTTDKDEASANRVLESLNAGLVTFASPISANLEFFPPVLSVDIIKETLPLWKTARSSYVASVTKWQSTLAEHYSAEAAGRQWVNLVKEVRG
ncbi:MAG: hypothetical protein ACRD5H_01935 [Nitrososphaerales archaeon]